MLSEGSHPGILSGPKRPAPSRHQPTRSCPDQLPWGGGVELTPQTLSEVEKVELGSASPCPSLGLSQREREEGRREEKREIAEICLVSG